MATSGAATRSAGQTSGVRAYERDTTAPGGPRVPLRGVMEDVGEQGLKEKLPWGETVDDAHGAATARTWPSRVRPRGRRRFERRGERDRQGLTALRQLWRAAPRRSCS